MCCSSAHAGPALASANSFTVQRSHVEICVIGRHEHCRYQSAYNLHYKEKYQSVLRAPSGRMPHSVSNERRNHYRIPPLLLLQLEQSESLLPRRSFRFPLQRDGFLLVPPGAPTGKGDDDHRKEEQRERHAKTPHRRSEVRMAARPAMVDAVSQDSKRAKVGSDHGQA
jgi:hypothetical protein